jgi:hypothetical protein
VFVLLFPAVYLDYQSAPPLLMEEEQTGLAKIRMVSVFVGVILFQLAATLVTEDFLIFGF